MISPAPAGKALRERSLASLGGAVFAAALGLRGSLRTPLSEDLAEPVLLGSLPSWPVLAVLAMAGAALGWILQGLCESRGRQGVFRPLLLSGVAFLAYLPYAVRAAPVLAAPAGRLLDLILAGAAAAALWRARPVAAFPIRMTARRTAMVFFAAYALLGIRIQRDVGFTGDEPHYLLVAYSLMHDRDLQVEDNYRERDYEAFYRGKIGPHLAHGTPYSVHGIGVPLLLLPGFALAGALGVRVTEALLGALIVGCVHRATEELTGRTGPALVAALAFGATAPALFLNLSAYPELPAALIVAAAFARFLSDSAPRFSLLWGLAFGLLPFLHMKFVPLAVVCGIAALAFWPAERKSIVLGMGLGFALWIGFFLWTTGSPNPLASYGRRRVFLSAVPPGLAGLFWDQEYGLLPVAPIYAAGIAGMLAVLRIRPRAGAFVVGALAAVGLTGAAHPLWFGGSSPPARFLFPALPLLAVASGRLGEIRGRASPLVSFLLLVSVLLGGYMAFGPDQPLSLNQRDGSGRVWESLGASWDLTHYLPSLVRADDRSWVMAFAASLLAALVLAIDRLRRRSALPALGLVLLGWCVFVDHLSPGSPPEGSLSRWTSSFLGRLPGSEDRTFLVLPEGQELSFEAALERLRVPLRSRPMFVPAGEYRLTGSSRERLELCNGEVCFARIQPEGRFLTRVALLNFHVRTPASPVGLRLEPLTLFPPSASAHRSLGGAATPRIHALDEESFPEPSGFWVRAGARARFLLEGECEGACLLTLTNGERWNGVEVAYTAGTVRFSLRPGESRSLELRPEAGLSFLTVACTSGFRPLDVDPRAEDSRRLGVFVGAPGF